MSVSKTKCNGSLPIHLHKVLSFLFFFFFFFSLSLRNFNLIMVPLPVFYLHCDLFNKGKDKDKTVPVTNTNVHGKVEVLCSLILNLSTALKTALSFTRQLIHHHKKHPRYLPTERLGRPHSQTTRFQEKNLLSLLGFEPL
jgi:hypothetical protein